MLINESSGPRVFLSLSLSLFQADPLERRGSLRPSREGAWGLREQSKSHVGGFIGFLHKSRNISLFLSFTFLSVDSGPPGSGPLKDLNSKPIQHNKDLYNFHTIVGYKFYSSSIDHKPEDTGTYSGTENRVQKLHGLQVLKSHRVCSLITVELC